MFIKGIVAQYGESTESFLHESAATEYDLISRGENHGIELQSNSLGYVLTSLLNIDFETVADIIADLNWEESAKTYIDPPVNYADMYDRLLSVSDIFKFYLRSEWDKIQNDLDLPQCGVSRTIERLKKYIAFCEQKRLPYNGHFFSFLLSNDYFGVTPMAVTPDDQIEEISSAFADTLDCPHDISDIYAVFMEYANQGVERRNSYFVDPDDRLCDLAMISFNEIASRGKIIRKCQNCGKYFIPTKRSDALYCDNPSPAAPEMTCKEYGTRRLWYERQKNDEIARLSRKIASAKGMLAKRNPDIPQYTESYEYFKAQRLVWINAVKDGTRTQEEYREWLLYMQGQKMIKEAGYGNA